MCDNQFSFLAHIFFILILGAVVVGKGVLGLVGAVVCELVLMASLTCQSSRKLTAEVAPNASMHCT